MQATESGGDQKQPVLRREPSFSRWCDEIPPSPDSSSDADNEQEEFEEEFELPLLTTSGAAFDIENNFNASELKEQDSSSSHSSSSFSAAVVVKTLLLVLVWYTLSTCLTLYNKTLLGEHLGHFPAPLLMNAIHFTLQAILSNVIVFFKPQNEESKFVMTWKDYFVRVLPTALGTALDINFSNASLMFISVTFATMCKSASPIFLLIFAFAFGLEAPSCKLLGIIIIISIGVLLTVTKETQFQFWGFFFVMLAAVMAGFRWAMTQILLQKETYGLKDPITLMSYLTPVMAVTTLISSFIFDPWHKFRKNNYFDDSRDIFLSSLLMLLGGALAFFMVLTEYVLVSVTSAVTITVAGIVKEAVTILVAVLYFHDQFTLLKGLGLLTIMFGVSLFNWYKYQKLKESHPSQNEQLMSRSSNGDVKYVPLEKMVSQDEYT